MYTVPCLDRPLTEDQNRKAVQWRATVIVQHQGPRVMMTELEMRLALVCASTDDGTILIWTVVDCPGSLQVVGHA